MASPGDVFLAYFPFGGRVGNKLRPVLVLTGPQGSVPEYLVAYMSSVIPANLLSSDIILDPSDPDHASTNLSAPTILRLHKLATIHQSDLARSLGKISAAVKRDVDSRLRILLNL